MNKFIRFAGVSVAVLAAVLLVGVANADAPTVAISGITGADLAVPYVMGSGTLTVNVTPTTVSVNGTLTHDPNVNPVQSVNLYVNAVATSSQVVPNGGNTFIFALPWTIPSAGNYTLTVTAKHGGCPTCTGSDEEVVAVIDLGSGGSGGGPSVNCPAAPAIATDYMHNGSNMPKSGSAKWKSIINYVAGQTGSNGIYWAKYACGGGPNKMGITYADQTAYANAVKAYVDSHK